jgi:hypothetical protein
MVTLFKLVHPENASCPMEVTVPLTAGMDEGMW